MLTLSFTLGLKNTFKTARMSQDSLYCDHPFYKNDFQRNSYFLSGKLRFLGRQKYLKAVL